MLGPNSQMADQNKKKKAGCLQHDSAVALRQNGALNIYSSGRKYFGCQFFSGLRSSQRY